MKAVIMAGGKGTRISSVSSDIPKVMLPIGDKPVLYHQIESLKKSNIHDIILIIGHLGHIIKEYIGDGNKFGIHVTYVEETMPLGTAGALALIKENISEDFVLLFGDVFLNVNFNRMISFHQQQKSDATLFVHPNLHPYDSVLVQASENNKITGIDTKRVARDYDYNNMVNAGIFVFSPKIFEYVYELKKTDLENEVIIPMIQDGCNLFAYKSTEYAKDMGTPDRYDLVNQDYKNGFDERRNLSNLQKCIFLDRDGTINKYVGFLTNINQMELIPGVVEAIRKINNSEYLCIVVTNQPVVARGEVTFEELANIHKRMETLLGNEKVFVDDIYYCPHHPHSGYEGEVKELKFDCDCRKPKTGMIQKAKENYNIDIENSYIIGDSTLDIKLGELAGMHSVLVHTGLAGSDKKYEVTPEMEALDLNDAVDKILRIRKKEM